MSLHSKVALAVILSQALSSQSFPLVDKRSKWNKPKNKFNLSDEQKELLKYMTPKEKKKFIRSLK